MNSRAKGKRGELAARDGIRQHLGVGARRTQQHCGRYGDADLDVDMPGTHFEVKNVKSIAAARFMDQAVRDAKADGDLPLVLMRENRGDWLVMVRLSDLAALATKVATRTLE